MIDMSTTKSVTEVPITRNGARRTSGYTCPECSRATLPPAVMPHSMRHCANCGLHFRPDHAHKS